MGPVQVCTRTYFGLNEFQVLQYPDCWGYVPVQAVIFVYLCIQASCTRSDSVGGIEPAVNGSFFQLIPNHIYMYMYIYGLLVPYTYKPMYMYTYMYGLLRHVYMCCMSHATCSTQFGCEQQYLRRLCKEHQTTITINNISHHNT